jgi:signal transduction histidine kinase
MNLLNNLSKALIIVIAIAFTVTISQIVPEKQFRPYQLSLDSTWAKTPENQEYIVDIDDDRSAEKVLHRNINQSGHSLEFFNTKGLPEVHIFDKNEFFISKYLKFHDLNMDQLKEVLFITVINRMAYLNIISYPMESHLGSLSGNVSKIRIDSISNYNTLPDVINFDMVFGESEIFFDLQAGYSANPRNIYKYNFRTKKLIKTSKNSIVNQKFELAEIGKKKYLLAKNVIASGNTVSPEILELLRNSKDKDTLRFYEILKHHVYTYGDFASYILLYNDQLDYAFPPVEYKGWTNYTKSGFIDIDGKRHIVSLTNTTEGDSSKRLITICNFRGEVINHFPHSGQYVAVFSNNDQIVLATGSTLHIYSAQLDLIHELPGITHSAGFFDINGDQESEFIAFRDNEMLVFGSDFQINATFKISQEFAPYPKEIGIGLLQIGDKHSFVFNTRLFYYLFSYSQNPFAIFKYPFYILVFSFWLGMLFLIMKLNSRRLVKEKQLLEEIVSERTAELQSKNLELSAQKEEIQTQAEKISEQYDQLEQLDQFKESLTHALVHDLKNPLSQIMLKTNNPTVNQSAGKMLRLIANMLDVEKYEHAKYELSKGVHSLRSMLEEVRSGQQISLNEKNLTLRCHFNDFQLLADREITIRVFDNLLTNAIRYSPLNSSIDVFADPTANDFIKISLRNYGEPIPKEAQPFIFDKYRQFGKNNSSTYRTTGLGLTFCKMAVEAHGGNIGVRSNPEEGTDFWFTIPFASKADGNNENLTHDVQPEIRLSASDREVLKTVVNKIREFEIYEISRFHEVLDPLKETSGTTVNKWISLLYGAIYIQNTDLFDSLIKLAENGQTKNPDR